MNEPNQPAKAVILGAGIAGLTAALRLGQQGLAPLLLESQSRPGGLAKCLHFKGVSTDMGPHRIHTELPEVDVLINKVAAPSLMRVSRTSHIYLDGRFLQYPPSPLEMGLRLGPLKLARFMGSFGLEKLRPRPAIETYESLMRGAFGQALYDYLIKPYSAKTWKTDPAQLHADTARVRVSAGSLAKMVGRLLGGERQGSETALKSFRYVRGGVETLVRHLWENAQQAGASLELDAEVETLDRDPQSGELTGVHTGNGNVRQGDIYLSTLPLPRLLGGLLPAAPDLHMAREAAAGLSYLDIIFVCLIVRRKSISGDNWLYFPQQDLIFNRGYEAKNMDPAMAPGDQSVICLEITLRQGDKIWGESDQALIQEVTRQIATTGLFGTDEVCEAFVHRLPYAYPIYSLDYDQRLEHIFDGLRRVPNLLTLGRQGLFNHNNMDHSMLMGLRAADTVAQAFASGAADRTGQASRRWYDQAEQFKHLRIVD